MFGGPLEGSLDTESDRRCKLNSSSFSLTISSLLIACALAGSLYVTAIEYSSEPTGWTAIRLCNSWINSGIGFLASFEIDRDGLVAIPASESSPRALRETDIQ